MSVGNGSHGNMLVFATAMLLLLGALYLTPSPISHARIVNDVFATLMSASTKWALSLKAPSRPAPTSRPMMKFESGYTVETVFDGSKLGVEPYAVEILPSGELLILDSANSNLYKIPSALSLYSRPKLVAGSAEGYAGHVDGRNREAKMNHPKGIAVDDRGNVYVADNMNMAIRKISDSGVTTIAGGKSGEAKLSSDLDVVYIGSSCSLLVIDRGNKAIREIQLRFDDCAYQYESAIPSGIGVILGAGVLGFMLAWLQRGLGLMSGSRRGEIGGIMKSVRPPLIPREEQEKGEEGATGWVGKVSIQEIRRALGKKESYGEEQWPAQDSYVIQEDDEAPAVETRTPTPTPTPRKMYPFMAKDAERVAQWQQGKSFWDDVGNQKKQLGQIASRGVYDVPNNDAIFDNSRKHKGYKI